MTLRATWASALAPLAVAAAVSGAEAQYQTIGVSSCATASCHNVKERPWWAKDKHSQSIKLLVADEAKTNAIAAKYGVAVDDIYNAKKSNCMSCHGAPISGEEEYVEEAVSCEACHGPGSGYKVVHQTDRAGALQKGLVDLEAFAVRATTCVRCHRVADAKLLAAGHPDGLAFDYVAGIKKVSPHWKQPPGPQDLDRAPFDKAKGKGGPIGATPKPKPPDPKPVPDKTAGTTATTTTATTTPAATTPVKAITTPTATTAPAAASGSSGTTGTPPRRDPSPPPERVPAPEPQPPANLGTVLPPDPDPVAVMLPPRPAVPDSASLGDLLRVVKLRLEQLYSQVQK